MAACAVPGLCLEAQIPDWYSTHKSLKYPSDLYIIGVGAGAGAKAADAAKKAAQMDLVSQIRVQVQGEVKNVTESFQFNKDEQLFSDYRSNIRTAVSDEISGMEVVETVPDDATGSTYALVVLDRDKYCETLRGEMDAQWKQADQLRVGSGDLAKKGKLNEAVQDLLDARKLIVPLLTKQTLYNVVAHSPYKPPVDFGPSTLSSDIRNILASVKVEKKGGDKQRGKIGESFSEPFVVQVTISQGNTTATVAGCTVIFEMPDKSKVDEGTTDEKGIASLATTIRAMKGSGIRARLSVGVLSREFEQNLLSSAVTFTWKAEQSDFSFALKITAKSAKITDNLKNGFTAAITEVGYKVAGSSKYVLDISVEASEAGKVEGLAGTMYSVGADVVVNLHEKESENVLGSVKFSGKGLARSESEAIDKAVANVKIDQNEMAGLLEKVTKK